VYTMDWPGPVRNMYSVCSTMYVWERCPTHSNPQIHLLWSWYTKFSSDRAEDLIIARASTLYILRRGAVAVPHLGWEGGERST
jgi:hypothetical protein